MTRGKAAVDGSEFTNKNGYRYRKVQGKWTLVARLVLETKLGRPLEDGERIKYVDGDRNNLKPTNLTYTRPKPLGKEAQIAKLEAQREELEAKLEILRSS